MRDFSDNMKRTAVKDKQWQDHYSRRAKKENFPARSIYKLKEIQQKYNLIKRGDIVLDLGCSPGSWLLYTANLAGSTGQVIGIDIQPVNIEVPSNAQIYIADVLSGDDAWLESLGLKFNVVLSDMAPATTGHKTVDAARSFNLCQAALAIAKRVLIADGTFVCKIFQGQDFNVFSEAVAAVFKEKMIFKPRSSRKASKEMFIIGLGLKKMP